MAHHSSTQGPSFFFLSAKQTQTGGLETCVCASFAFLRLSGGSQVSPPNYCPIRPEIQFAVSVVSLALYAFDAQFFPDSLVLHSKHLFP